MKISHDTAVNTMKPNIVKDAMMGLITSVSVGIIASLVFVLVVLFLSSNALANVPVQYSPVEMERYQVHQGCLLFRTQQQGVDRVSLWQVNTDFLNGDINIGKSKEFPVNQVNSSRPNILTAHLGRGHAFEVVEQRNAPQNVTFPNVDY